MFPFLPLQPNRPRSLGAQPELEGGCARAQYAAKGYEYFDVWAPEIATHYGEVFWTDQGVTPLPDEIIKRFDGKVMVRAAT